MSHASHRVRTRARAALALLAAALLARAAVLAAGPPAIGRPIIGRPAPPLIVRELDGHEFDLARLRGKVVLVNLWATWCSPCRYEMPVLNRFYRRYHDRGLELLGLSIDEPPDFPRVHQVMRSFGYPAAIASSASVNGFGEPIAVPVTYVIDAHGVLRAALMAEGPKGVPMRLLERTVLPLLAKVKRHG